MIIHSKIKDYRVEMVKNILQQRDKLFSKLRYDRLFYFIDENVYKIYEKDLKLFISDDFYFIIPANEINKEYLKISEYYRVLIEAGFTRKNDVLVTFGGGILQDISGFVASTLYRGIRWIFFPTTLLAQADSCIGSKTSINFGNSKNLIGSFYPPDTVYIDEKFCQTLTDEYFNSGIGEIIKFHLMADKEAFVLLRKFLSSPNLRKSPYIKKMILSTLEIKKSYFEGDEFDTERRNLLNYGHCFGHALESAADFAISHGEAVIVGIGFANLLSLKRRLMNSSKYEEFESLLRKHCPRFDISKVDIKDIIFYMKRDKKRVGKDLTMILSEDIGRQQKFNDIKEEELLDTFRDFLEIYPSGATKCVTK